VEVRRDEQCVVVEHLLEVRDEPPRVDRVAMEAAADEVVEAAGGHPVERAPHHAERLGAAAAQEQLQRGRRRELRRRAEAAEGRLVVAGQVALRRVEQRRAQLGVARGQPGRAAERADEPAGLGFEVAPPVPPRLGDRLQELPEARHPMPRLGREVRAGVEGPAVGRQEDRRRPATVAGRRHARVHRHRIDVRALLAVDLDVDEQVVHQRRRRGVGERLVLHHVTPVARAVPDGDQERPVRFAGERKRLVAPRVPVDGVLRVLEEVGARRSGEAVHDAVLPHSVRRPAGVVSSPP
jgi:hypothetical protein